MRKTADLVHEMQEEAKTAWLVAIAVGFENETKFVFSSSKQPLEDLNRLVKMGGFPVGLLRFEKEKNTVEGLYRPFEENVTVPWIKNYFTGLLENIQDIIVLSQNQKNLPEY